MRRSDLLRVVEALRPPIRRFVTESRVRIALLVNGSGQVLAQHGFTRNFEVMNVASLAAAAYASARALAEHTGAGVWQHLHHAGRERQLFLAPVWTPIEDLIVVVIFDAESSLGIVQLFFDKLQSDIAALPEFGDVLEQQPAASFEQDLAAGLEHLSPEMRSED